MLAEAETLEDIVIAEGIPGFYDFDGKRVFQPRKKVHPWFERRPMGSFLSQPLTVFCSDIGEIRSFLKTCRYVSDQEQFGVKDHWAPPEVFERTRKGDCDDFALWTWRQLLALGYNTRFVVGRSGRYGSGHAWVTVRINERNYVLEPQLSPYQAFPRLTTLRYQPAVSVGVSHNRVKFFRALKTHGGATVPGHSVSHPRVAPILAAHAAAVAALAVLRTRQTIPTETQQTQVMAPSVHHPDEPDLPRRVG